MSDEAASGEICELNVPINRADAATRANRITTHFTTRIRGCRFHPSDVQAMAARLRPSRNPAVVRTLGSSETQTSRHCRANVTGFISACTIFSAKGRLRDLLREEPLHPAQFRRNNQRASR
jgi:hypothetical protein